MEKIQVEGTITSSTILTEDVCYNTYTSTLDTGEETISFEYEVSSQQCSGGGIFDTYEQPFYPGVRVRATLTEDTPYQLITSNTLFTQPAATEERVESPASVVESAAPSMSLIGGLLVLAVCVGVICGIVLKRKK
jgi:hypothetical protein